MDGATIYTIRDDLELDMESMSSRIALNSMNHAAILDERTIAFTSVRDMLTQGMAAAAGDAPSLADDTGIAPLLPSLPPDLVSALIFAGSALAGSVDAASLIFEVTPGADIDVIATEIAAAHIEAQRMPPIVAAVLGQTAGGPLSDLGGAGDETPSAMEIPTAKAFVALSMIHAGAAETAASVIEERLTTMAPPARGDGDEPPPTYAELFPEFAVHVAEGEPVVVVEMTPAADVSPRVLVDLLFVRGLNLLAWEP